MHKNKNKIHKNLTLGKILGQSPDELKIIKIEQYLLKSLTNKYKVTRLKLVS